MLKSQMKSFDKRDSCDQFLRKTTRISPFEKSADSKGGTTFATQRQKQYLREKPVQHKSEKKIHFDSEVIPPGHHLGPFSGLGPQVGF